MQYLPRPIVHDPDLLSGRWHLAGTSIAVGEIRLDHAISGSRPGYANPGVSSPELAACLEFGFPPVRDSTVSLLAGTAMIACACGEDTAAVGSASAPIPCVCGRVWRIRLLLESVVGSGASPRDPSVQLIAAP